MSATKKSKTKPTKAKPPKPKATKPVLRSPIAQLRNDVDLLEFYDRRRRKEIVALEARIKGLETSDCAKPPRSVLQAELAEVPEQPKIKLHRALAEYWEPCALDRGTSMLHGSSRAGRVVNIPSQC